MMQEVGEFTSQEDGTWRKCRQNWKYLLCKWICHRLPRKWM